MAKNITVGIDLKALGGAAAALAVIKFLKEATVAADRQAQAEAQLAASLKSTKNAAGLTGKELKKMAADLQKVTLFGDEATIQAQSMMLTFTKVGKEVFPDAIKATQNLATKMGTDLKSATILVGKALNDPIVGLSALSRVGVKVSDTNKDLIKSFVETGQTAKAQTVILGELETQFGGSAEAAAQAGLGPFKQMMNALGDITEEVGANLLPAINKFSVWVTDNMPLISAIADAIMRFASIIAMTLKGIFQGVATVIGLAVAGVATALEKMVGSVASVLEMLPDSLVPDSWIVGLRSAETGLREFGEVTAAASVDMASDFLGTLGDIGEAFTKTGGEARKAKEAIADVVAETPDDVAAETPTPDQSKIEAALAAIQSIHMAFQQLRMSDRERELDDINRWVESQSEIIGANLVGQEELMLVARERRSEINAEFDEVDAEQSAAAAEKEKQTNLNRVNVFLGVASKISATFSSITKAWSDSVKDQQKKDIERVKNSNKSAKEKQKAIEKINKEAEAEQKRIAGVNKGIAIVNAVINTALGITAALGSGPPPASIVLAAIVGVLGAVQIALIASQSFAEGGIVQGASTTGDNTLVRANAGELILNPMQQNRLLSIAEGRTGAGTSPQINLGGDTIIIQGGADESAIAALQSTRIEQVEMITEALAEAAYQGQIAEVVL